jgi:hypothetical protein
VNDDLRLCLKDRCRQRFGVEYVNYDRERAQLPENFPLVRRTRRAPDRVALGQEKRREPAANDPSRAS